MTLIKKMALGVLGMLFLVFMGTFLITMNNSRNYFIQQIESNAQDTATSLGMSLSQSLMRNNFPTMNTMVQAVFDRGYFSFIQVKDMKGKIIITKRSFAQHKNVPQWFIDWMQWPSTEKSSLVVDGWMQVGIVSVVSDPHYVYVSLWRNAVGMLKAYVIFALISLLLTYGFIQILLRPLKRVTAQALAISDHEFPIETNIPKTAELKQVTLAMNQMVTKIKSIFENQLQQAESLRIQVYQDPLTGLSNRRYFVQQLSAILDNKDDFIPGYVLMIVIDGLDEVNQKQGFQQGDQLILTIARICKDFWSHRPGNTLARISGSTFALITHELNAQIFDDQCKEFEQNLKQAISDVALCDPYMGATGYFVHQSVSNLLYMVDLSVKKARETGVFYCQKDHDIFKYPRLINRDNLINSINQKKISLYAQKVTNGKDYLHKEVFVRLNYDNEELGAGYFIPVAAKLGLAHLVDVYVLQELTAKQSAHDDFFAINISENTLLNTEHRETYLQHLKNTPKNILKNLSLEINEAQVLASFSEIKLFTKEAQKLGVKIGIDRVGIHFSQLNYLSELHIDYLKLHGSLVQDIDENQSKQFFIHYFIEMAKTLDIKVIATQVEQEVQWKALETIHISWGQGRYLAPVVLIE